MSRVQIVVHTMLYTIYYMLHVIINDVQYRKCNINNMTQIKHYTTYKIQHTVTFSLHRLRMDRNLGQALQLAAICPVNPYNTAVQVGHSHT
jgi:hypothetical protein